MLVQDHQIHHFLIYLAALIQLHRPDSNALSTTILEKGGHGLFEGTILAFTWTA